MKLTGGLDRGRKLTAPRGLKTRPTGAKVREAIFNILGAPPNAPVLDLFAGTGALGMEALSRGAPAAVFVEKDARALAALRRNLHETGLQARSTIISRDVAQALAALLDRADAVDRFGWVFVDPPYAAGLAESVLRSLDRGLLIEEAVVVVEHDKHHLPPQRAGDLACTDQRFYGDTGLSFYRCQVAGGLS